MDCLLWIPWLWNPEPDLSWVQKLPDAARGRGVLIWLSGSRKPMEKAVAPHSSTLAWKIPRTEEPGGQQSMGSRRVGHDWATSLSLSCIGEGNGNPLQCSCLENPRDGEPGGLPSMGSHRVGHDWSDLAAAAAENQRLFSRMRKWGRGRQTRMHCSAQSILATDQTPAGACVLGRMNLQNYAYLSYT